jgi:hypothetical protein
MRRRQRKRRTKELSGTAVVVVVDVASKRLKRRFELSSLRRMNIIYVIFPLHVLNSQLWRANNDWLRKA